MKEIKATKSSSASNQQKVIPLRPDTKKGCPELLLRNAFKMKLKAGYKQEYKKRHDEIWPQLSEVLTNAGISDYSIFLDEETDTLFAFQKLTPGHTSADLPNDPIVRKWWDYMSDIMEYNEDNTPVAISLEEMFHAD